MAWQLPTTIGIRSRPPDGSPAVVDGLTVEVGYYDRRMIVDGTVLEVSYMDLRIFFDGVTLEVAYT